MMPGFLSEVVSIYVNMSLICLITCKYPVRIKAESLCYDPTSSALQLVFDHW